MGEVKVKYFSMRVDWYRTIEQHKGKRGYDTAFRYIVEYIAYCYGVSAEPDINTLGTTAKKIVTKVLNSFSEDMQSRGCTAQYCADQGNKGKNYGNNGGAPMGNQNARKRTSEQAEAQRLEHPAMSVEAESAEAGGNTIYHIRPRDCIFTGNEMEDDDLWWWCDAGTNKEVEERIRNAIANEISFEDMTMRGGILDNTKQLLPPRWAGLQRDLRKLFSEKEIAAIEPHITNEQGINKVIQAIATIKKPTQEIQHPFKFLQSKLDISYHQPK